MVEHVKYARSCLRRIDGHLCGASPASTVDVVGVGRTDLCARHAVEYLGIQRREIPDVIGVSKRAPVLLGTTGEMILEYIAAHPDRSRREISADTGIGFSVCGEWCSKLVKRGYLLAIRDLNHKPPIHRYRLMGPSLEQIRRSESAPRR